MITRQPIKASLTEAPAESLFDSKAIRRLLLTNSDQISPNLLALNHGVLKPGLRLPWFLHSDRDEIIIPLTGSAVVHFGEGFQGEKDSSYLALEVGDVISIPAGVQHSVENSGEIDFEAIFFKVRA